MPVKYLLLEYYVIGTLPAAGPVLAVGVGGSWGATGSSWARFGSFLAPWSVSTWTSAGSGGSATDKTQNVIVKRKPSM